MRKRIAMLLLAPTMIVADPLPTLYSSDGVIYQGMKADAVQSMGVTLITKAQFDQQQATNQQAIDARVMPPITASLADRVMALEDAVLTISQQTKIPVTLDSPTQVAP